jgi:hypothetical protein
VTVLATSEAGAAVIVTTILARALAAVWVSTALLLTVAGLVLGPFVLGWFDAAVETDAIHLIAGLALATALFSDGR